MTHRECKKCKHYSNEYGTNFCWRFCRVIDEIIPCDDYFKMEIRTYRGDDINLEQQLYKELSSDKNLYNNFKPQFKEWKEELENKIYQEK